MLKIILIVVISAYSIFLPIMRIANSDKQFLKGRLSSVLAAFVFSSALIYLVDILTFKYVPGRGISGNGNLAIIPILLLVPIWIHLVTIIGRLSYRVYQEIEHEKKIVPLFIQLILLVLSFLAENSILQNHISILGVPGDPNAIIYRWTWFNQYTNTIFVNYVVFGISILVSNLVGMLLTLKKQVV